MFYNNCSILTNGAAKQLLRSIKTYITTFVMNFLIYMLFTCFNLQRAYIVICDCITFTTSERNYQIYCKL